MAAIHTATAGPLVSALVADVRAETTEWLELYDHPSQGLSPDARSLVLAILEELDDHLQIRLAATLAEFGITTSGEKS